MDYEKLVADIPAVEDPAEVERRAKATQPGTSNLPPIPPGSISPQLLESLERSLNGGERPDPSAPPPPLPQAPREYLPLNHEKYQGIAEAKGYAQGDDFSGNRLQKVRYTHEAMIDVIIAEPTITQNELAKRFDRSVSWISIVMGSDAFQAALAKRRDDVTDPFLVATIEERFRGLATQSLAVIARKLEETSNIDVAFKALDVSAKALGFGARAPDSGKVAVSNQFVVQLPPAQTAEEWARAHNPANRTIEASS